MTTKRDIDDPYDEAPESSTRPAEISWLELKGSVYLSACPNCGYVYYLPNVGADLAAARAEVARLNRNIDSWLKEEAIWKEQEASLLADLAAARAEMSRLREALHTIMAFRAENLRVTCPGEHDYEPDCTHGVNHCPIMLTAKAALEEK